MHVHEKYQILYFFVHAIHDSKRPIGERHLIEKLKRVLIDVFSEEKFNHLTIRHYPVPLVSASLLSQTCSHHCMLSVPA